jgi:signal transduction histidine kinase
MEVGGFRPYYYHLNDNLEVKVAINTKMIVNYHFSITLGLPSASAELAPSKAIFNPPTLMATTTSLTDVQQLRERLLDDAMRWILFLALPGMVMSLTRLPALGWRMTFIIQLSGCLIFPLFVYYRQYIPFNVRAGLLLAVLAIVGISGYSDFGLTATAGQFLIMLVFLAGLLLEKTAFYRVCVLLVASLSVVGWAVVNGALKINLDYQSFIAAPGNWVLTIYVVIGFGGIVALLGRKMFDALLAKKARLEILNQELAKRTAEAESANRLKSEFLANLSHEFRTPLNGIICISDLLQIGDLTNEQSKLLDELHVSANRLQKMVDRMLDYIQLESNLVKPTNGPFAIRELVQKAVNDIQSRATAKGLVATLNFSAGVPDAAITDGRRLKQLLGEILDNAVNFTHAGAIKVDVDLTPPGNTTDTTWWINLVIEDTGIGIRDEDKPSIFQAFFQANGSASRTIGGNGLGLAISYRIVKLLGGEIHFVSDGSGTTFTIAIPVIAHAIDD